MREKVFEGLRLEVLNAVCLRSPKAWGSYALIFKYPNPLVRIWCESDACRRQAIGDTGGENC